MPSADIIRCRGPRAFEFAVAQRERDPLGVRCSLTALATDNAPGSTDPSRCPRVPGRIRSAHRRPAQPLFHATVLGVVAALDRMQADERVEPLGVGCPGAGFSDTRGSPVPASRWRRLPGRVCSAWLQRLVVHGGDIGNGGRRGLVRMQASASALTVSDGMSLAARRPTTTAAAPTRAVSRAISSAKRSAAACGVGDPAGRSPARSTYGDGSACALKRITCGGMIALIAPCGASHLPPTGVAGRVRGTRIALVKAIPACSAAYAMSIPASESAGESTSRSRLPPCRADR